MYNHLHKYSVMGWSSKFSKEKMGARNTCGFASFFILDQDGISGVNVWGLEDSQSTMDVPEKKGMGIQGFDLKRKISKTHHLYDEHDIKKCRWIMQLWMIFWAFQRTFHWQRKSIHRMEKRSLWRIKLSKVFFRDHGCFWFQITREIRSPKPSLNTKVMARRPKDPRWRHLSVFSFRMQSHPRYCFGVPRCFGVLTNSCCFAEIDWLKSLNPFVKKVFCWEGFFEVRYAEGWPYCLYFHMTLGYFTKFSGNAIFHAFTPSDLAKEGHCFR